LALILPVTVVAAGKRAQQKLLPSGGEILRQVQADVLAKRWEQAEARLAAAASRLETNSEYHFLRAAVLLHGQKLASGLREVDHAIAIAPQHARYYLLRGQLYEAIRDIAAAQRDYQKNIDLAPTSAAGVLLLERLLIQERRTEEALPVLEGAVKRMPKDPALYFELGRVQEILRRPNQALGSYTRAVELDPKLAAAHVGLGRLYRDNPQTLVESAKHLRQAVTLDPRRALWHHELGLTYLRQGKLEGARVELEKAAGLNPKDRNVFAALGTAYTRLKMPEKAAEAQRRSFRLTQEAEADLQQVAQLEVDFKRAQELEFSGRGEEAASLYEKILKTSPREPQVYFALARLRLNARQPEKAVEYIRRALEDRPTKADYHELYSMTLLELGQLSEAEEELHTAIVLEPTDAASHKALGNLLLKQGRVDEAVKALDQAVRLAPDEASYRLDLSSAYRQKGDMIAADREYVAYQRLLRPKQPGPE
jgi:tetratricopeptide (TPR) repeat protein